MLWFRKLKQFIALNFTLKRIARFFLNLLLLLLIFLLIVPVYLVVSLNRYYRDYIYSDLEKVPEVRVAIVFGAGLTSHATEPSGVLQDRILAAVELYKAGKVEKILMSGTNNTPEYNEPLVMMRFARENGVSSFDLQADYAGRRTYDTCYRAKYIFGIEKAILITQDFHLTRALYTCNNLGIESIGYSADRMAYQNLEFFALRDFAATLLAYWELHVAPPEVMLGEKINF